MTPLIKSNNINECKKQINLGMEAMIRTALSLDCDRHQMTFLVRVCVCVLCNSYEMSPMRTINNTKCGSCMVFFKHTSQWVNRSDKVEWTHLRHRGDEWPSANIHDLSNKSQNWWGTGTKNKQPIEIYQLTRNSRDRGDKCIGEGRGTRSIKFPTELARLTTWASAPFSLQQDGSIDVRRWM